MIDLLKHLIRFGTGLLIIGLCVAVAFAIYGFMWFVTRHPMIALGIGGLLFIYGLGYCFQTYDTGYHSDDYGM